MMAAVFSMQGMGQFIAALVALIVTVCFKDSFINTTAYFSSCDTACQLAGDRAWRIIVGFGALPACFALYYRITIPETPRYTFDIARDIEKADADIKAYVRNQAEGVVDPVSQQKTKQRLGKKLTAPRASWQDLWSYFSQWKNFKIIFGTAASWYVVFILILNQHLFEHERLSFLVLLLKLYLFTLPVRSSLYAFLHGRLPTCRLSTSPFTLEEVY
jgi:PHS family inorganic phosphate transporter-like MFS transporter